VDEGQRPSIATAFKSRWAMFGAAAIFLYVGAEVSIGSAMTNFLHEPDMLNIPLDQAGKMVSYYWGGAMVGRLVGSLLLFIVKQRAPWLLAGFATGAVLLCLLVSQLHGTTAAYLALSIGLFNSIMFPVIFTSTLERSTAAPAATSGLLCLAIVGGAILPYIYGLIADAAGLHTAYFLPAVAYGLIVVFAVAATRAPTYEHGTATASGGH
jgi:FHS family L-fucose permease-like MFS transporter